MGIFLFSVFVYISLCFFSLLCVCVLYTSRVFLSAPYFLVKATSTHAPCTLAKSDPCAGRRLVVRSLCAAQTRNNPREQGPTDESKDSGKTAQPKSIAGAPQGHRRGTQTNAHRAHIGPTNQPTRAQTLPHLHTTAQRRGKRRATEERPRRNGERHLDIAHERLLVASPLRQRRTSATARTRCLTCTQRHNGGESGAPPFSMRCLSIE